MASGVLTQIPSFFSEMFAYREYLTQSVSRDLKNKYKRSALGYVWTMLHPLAMMVVLAVVFSNIMRINVRDYAIFLFAGLLPWNYFSSSAMMSLGTIRNNARLFSQVALPKHIFVLSISFSNLFNLVVALIPLFILIIALGRPLPVTLLLFPVLLVPLFLLVVGISLILAVCSVYFDDTLHLTEVGLSVLYFLSPILYRREDLPGYILPYVTTLNPFFTLIESFREISYYGTVPSLAQFGIHYLTGIAILTIGLIIFRRCEDRFLYLL